VKEGQMSNVKPDMRQLYYFSLAVLLAILLLWIGDTLLFKPTDSFNATLLFLAGCGLILAAVFSVGSGIHLGWKRLLAIIILGFYLTARAIGTVKVPWLARIGGGGSWIAAGYLIYKTWPTRSSIKPVSELGKQDAADA
jgi:hypothetical protein